MLLAHSDNHPDRGPADERLVGLQMWLMQWIRRQLEEHFQHVETLKRDHDRLDGFVFRELEPDLRERLTEHGKRLTALEQSSKRFDRCIYQGNSTVDAMQARINELQRLVVQTNNFLVRVEEENRTWRDWYDWRDWVLGRSQWSQWSSRRKSRNKKWNRRARRRQNKHGWQDRGEETYASISISGSESSNNQVDH